MKKRCNFYRFLTTGTSPQSSELEGVSSDWSIQFTLEFVQRVQE